MDWLLNHMNDPDIDARISENVHPDIDQSKVDMLLSFGFEEKLARKALKTSVELQEGPLDQFTHEMKPFLQKQGMPVRLNEGAVELVSDFVVCEEGKPLSPEAAWILRLLGNKMSTFPLNLICRWSPDEFEIYKKGLEESDIESS